jgi:hypothetical protein
LTLTPTNSPTNTATSTPSATPTEAGFIFPTPGPQACSNHPLPPRLTIGEPAYILPIPPESNLIRSGPSRTGTQRLGLLHPGERFEVLDGPVCGDSTNYWLVEKRDGIMGWTGEGGFTDGYDYIYWMAPIGVTNNQPPGFDGTSSRSNSGGACPNAPPSLFHIGDMAVVDFNSLGALQVTSNPEGGGEVLIEVQDNATLRIIGGPVCGTSGDRWRWLVEHVGSGTIGWVSEGVVDDTWMCPEHDPECSD